MRTGPCSLRRRGHAQARREKLSSNSALSREIGSPSFSAREFTAAKTVGVGAKATFRQSEQRLLSGISLRKTRPPCYRHRESLEFARAPTRGAPTSPLPPVTC